MIKSNITSITKLFKKMPKAVEAAFNKGANEGLQVYLGRFTREYLQKRTGNKGLNRQTGTLAGSFSITQNKQRSSFLVATDCKYAHVHAHANGFNGVIKPKNGKYLVFKTNSGYVRAKQVYIPKRLFFYESYNKYGVDYVLKGFKKYLLQTLKQG
jgi:phage gpG-like protein